MMSNKWKRGTAGLVLPLLVMGILALTGCESDSVTPDDPNPELTLEDAAHQAAVVVLGIAEVGPRVVRVAPVKTVYTHEFDGTDGITGTVQMDFRMGGPEGASASATEGTWAGLMTLGGNGLVLQTELGGTMYLAVGLTCTINQATSTATMLPGSGGTFIAGVYATAFTLDGLEVSAASDYPVAGGMTFTSGPHTLDITFDGTRNALISVDGSPHWTVNMDTGDLVEIR